jgi:thiamine pyrophosphate-dependent acetolactate synthase large subunit-like protein
LAVGTRYNAEHTLLGNIADICHALTQRIDFLVNQLHRQMGLAPTSLNCTSSDVNDKKLLSINERLEHLVDSTIHDAFEYAAHNSPHQVIQKVTSEFSTRTLVTLPKLDVTSTENVQNEVSRLWSIMHNGDWRKIQEIHQSTNKYAARRFEINKQSNDAASSEQYCHPADVLYALSDLRDAESQSNAVFSNAVITVDVGDVTLWASLCLHLRGGSRTLYSERLGTMGYALNAGVAAILSQPAPSGAVVLAGDGGFQMSLQELSTFQQMKRPGDQLICIVFDNQTLGRVAFGFDDAKGCDVIGPDYVALAQAYGGNGIRLDQTAKAQDTVKDAASMIGLVIVHVIVDPHVKADMATFKDKALKVMKSG